MNPPTMVSKKAVPKKFDVVVAAPEGSKCMTNKKYKNTLAMLATKPMLSSNIIAAIRTGEFLFVKQVIPFYLKRKERKIGSIIVHGNIVYPPKMKYVALYPPFLGSFTCWYSTSLTLASSFESYI